MVTVAVLIGSNQSSLRADNSCGNSTINVAHVPCTASYAGMLRRNAAGCCFLFLRIKRFDRLPSIQASPIYAWTHTTTLQRTQRRLKHHVKTKSKAACNDATTVNKIPTKVRILLFKKTEPYSACQTLYLPHPCKRQKKK